MALQVLAAPITMGVSAAVYYGCQKILGLNKPDRFELKTTYNGNLKNQSIELVKPKHEGIRVKPHVAALYILGAAVVGAAFGVAALPLFTFAVTVGIITGVTGVICDILKDNRNARTNPT